MFPRRNRLRKSSDIVLVQRKGRRISGGSLSCSFISKPGTVSRVTVVVGTKVSKKATVRNLLKRQIRAILQSSDLPAGDLVVHTYPELKKSTFTAIQTTLNQCLKRLS